MLYIGIDLGTSASKFLLVDEVGRVLNTVTKEYPLSFPRPGWSEQDPAHWWQACLAGVPELLAGFDAKQVAGIGVGGQMHGLVALDAAGNVLHPAILWNDGRTAAQVDYLNETVGNDKLSAWTGNIAFAGFTAPKLLWMRQNEPDLFARIAKILLPKDYLVYRLTGVHATDYSDASGTLLLDVAHKRWSSEMLDLCGVTEAQMPTLFDSWQPVGTLTAAAATALGLPTDVVVCAGAGDYAAAQEAIVPEKLGRSHVFYLPYLMGERSPINDTNARAVFLGMTMDTTRADMTQAMLEGVAFALRDSVEVARSLGLDISRSTLCGGGSRSPLWRTILANVLGIPLDLPATEQGPGYGAALLALVACGRYRNVAEVSRAMLHIQATVQPDPELTALYDARYAEFKQIYPACRPLFASLAGTP